MVRYASHFELVMGLRPGYNYVVDFKDGTSGLYLNRYSGFSNKFGTGLAFRGTHQEVADLVEGRRVP